MLIKKSSENGFSYIDVLIAIVILMVGILAMLSALTANLLRSYESERRIIAKQLALSTVESIISAKEIERVGVIDGWDSLQNVTGAPPPGRLDGIFLTGFNPVREEFGWDGVAGTVDDACAGAGTCTHPVSSVVNSSPIVSQVERQIVITDVIDPERPPPNEIAIRRIDVTIRFFINGLGRQETASTLITDYDQTN